MRIIRTIVIGLATVLALAAPQLAKAQDFPTRPVRIVVAFPPGGPTDFVGRMIADKMTTLLGQRVYIDNKPGANGTLGGGDVAKSDPDGYSLFLTTAGAVTVSPHIQAKMPFDTFRDFAPVALVTKVTEVLVVSPKLGVKNVKDLVALAKQKPGAVTFASTGVGSPPHLAQILLATAAGVKFLHVPYRGAAPALTDLLGGQVQVVSLDMPVVIAQIQAGTLLPIGVAGEKRDAVVARRSDAGRTGLSEHRRIELVRAVGAGEDAARGDRQAQQGGQRRAQRSGGARQARQSWRHAGRRHAAIARDVPQVGIRQMGPRRRSQWDQGAVTVIPDCRGAASPESIITDRG